MESSAKCGLEEDELLSCCGSTKFAKQMSAFSPFLHLHHAIEVATDIWFNKVDVCGWLEAFSAHPQIGQSPSSLRATETSAQWSKGEQSTAIETATSTTLQELTEWNARYKEKFGFVFLICASGRSTAEILAELKRRYSNRPVVELEIAAEEQMKVTELRLAKLFTDKASTVATDNQPAVSAKANEEVTDSTPPGEKGSITRAEYLWELKTKKWQERKKEIEESGTPSQTTRSSSKRPSIPKSKDKRQKTNSGEAKKKKKSDEDKNDEESEGVLPIAPDVLVDIRAKVRDSGTSHQEAESDVPLGPLPGIVRTDRAKVVKDMVKSVDLEYAQALRGFHEAFISSIQQDLADALLRLEGAKAWRARMVKDVRESHKEAKNILKLKKDCDAYLRLCSELVDKRDKACEERNEAQAQTRMAAEEVCALKVILSKKEAAEAELCSKLKAKTMEVKKSELATLDNILATEELMKGKVKIAWEQAFPEDNYSWFAKYVDWADLKVEAEKRGITPPSPPVEPEEGAGSCEDDATS
ncbi:Uric acid degradation bifunctional protein TTL [Bienertia sinuspersici]